MTLPMLEFAHSQHIRGDDAAEAEAEYGRDGEEPGLALGGQETDHSYELANGVGEDRAQAADPVGDKAPNLPAQKSETEQHREHRRADRRRNPDIGAQSHRGQSHYRRHRDRIGPDLLWRLTEHAL